MAHYEIDTEFEQEWGTFLNEVRTVLPGVQLLFAFLLTVPFNPRFTLLTSVLRAFYFGSFLCTTAACAFLIAPSVYHRLHWRRNVEDKQVMFRTCSRLAIIGGALLAVAMILATFVISSFVVDLRVGLVVAPLCVVTFGWLWFGLPLSRKWRERAHGPRHPG